MDQNEPNFDRYTDNCRYFSFLEGVANFNLNFLSHFSINFENSCAHFAANFLNLSKHTQILHIGCIWKKLWQFKKNTHENLIFKNIFFCWVAITSFKCIQNVKVVYVLTNSGNLLHNEHKNFQNWLRNDRKNWDWSWQPSLEKSNICNYPCIY